MSLSRARGWYTSPPITVQVELTILCPHDHMNNWFHFLHKANLENGGKSTSIQHKPGSNGAAGQRCSFCMSSYVFTPTDTAPYSLVTRDSPATRSYPGDERHTIATAVRTEASAPMISDNWVFAFAFPALWHTVINTAMFGSKVPVPLDFPGYA